MPQFWMLVVAAGRMVRRLAALASEGNVIVGWTIRPPALRSRETQMPRRSRPDESRSRGVRWPLCRSQIARSTLSRP